MTRGDGATGPGRSGHEPAPGAEAPRTATPRGEAVVPGATGSGGPGRDTDTSGRPNPDGRRARGERRRAEIIEATLRVVQRDGASGVTHRTVAREAGVRASLTTYYFATLDDLLVAALSAVTEEYATALAAILDRDRDLLGDLAALLAESATGPGRARALAERELSTLAARRPALRPVARHWRDRVAEIGRRRSSDPTAAEALVAASDGLCAGLLLSGEAPDVDRIRAVLARAVGEQDTP